MTRPRHFSVPPEHPALAGHFPGNPIVPASMILDQVIAAWGAPCRGVHSAKFHRPLRADRLVQIGFGAETNGDGVGFCCRCGGELICSGELITGQVG